MASDGTWNLFQRGFSTNFYDVQARSLLAGHWWMPASVLSIEGFKTGAHSYMYFGPVPALIRLPVLLFTHQLDGKLSGLSMLVALVMALAFTSCLLWRVRGLLRRSAAPVSGMEAFLIGGLLFVVGAGSPLLYQASLPSVYDEAELWACAFALGALYFMIAFILRHSRGSFLLTGLFVALALFTRAPVGFGLLGGLLILAAVDYRNQRQGDGLRWAAGLVVMVGILGIMYAGLNEVKFHSLFGVPFQRQAAVHFGSLDQLAVRKNGGSLFSARFIPTNLLNYLRPDAIRFTSLFPWITYAPTSIVGKLAYAGIQSPTSLPATTPALVVLSVTGLIGIFRRGKHVGDVPQALGAVSPGLGVLRIPALGAALAAVSIFVYGFLASRYLLDLMPLVIVTAVAGFCLIVRAAPWPQWARRSLAGALVVLGLFSVWAESAVSLVFQGASGPFRTVPERAAFIRLRDHIDGTVLGNPTAGVELVRAVPKDPGPPGVLALVGNCTSLYQSSGRIWWAVESSNAGGRFRFRIVGEPGSAGETWPLLVEGDKTGGAVLALRNLGHGLADVWYRYDDASPLTKGTPFPLNRRGTEALDVTVGVIPATVTVTANGATVLSAFAQIPPEMTSTRNAIGGPAGSLTRGPIETLRVTTPICAGLLHTLRLNGHRS